MIASVNPPGHACSCTAHGGLNIDSASDAYCRVDAILEATAIDERLVAGTIETMPFPEVEARSEHFQSAQQVRTAVGPASLFLVGVC